LFDLAEPVLYGLLLLRCGCGAPLLTGKANLGLQPQVPENVR